MKAVVFCLVVSFHPLREWSWRGVFLLDFSDIVVIITGMATNQDYSWVTDEMFDGELEKVVAENASTLLSVPGVYEAVREHFNNEVLTRLENAREEEDED